MRGLMVCLSHDPNPKEYVSLLIELYKKDGSVLHVAWKQIL